MITLKYNSVLISQSQKGRREKSYLNMGLFIVLQHEVVDRMPWKTIGNQIYVIKCSEDYWWDKQIDGYHWKFTEFSGWSK